MSAVIRISSDLYDRLSNLASGFDTPANVIERLLNHYEKTSSELRVPEPRPRSVTGRLEVVLYPDGEKAFKSALLEHKAAWVLLHYVDGATHLHEWRASRFSNTSSVKGNLNSGYLRDWRKKGIVKCEVAINKDDLSISE